MSAGAILASMRKTRTITCPQCGETATVLERAEYCSDTCRWRAAYKRRKSAGDAARATGGGDAGSPSGARRKKAPRAS